MLPIERTMMTGRHFAEGQIIFREGDPSDGVFRLLRGTVEVVRELDGDLILLGTVGAGQLVGEMVSSKTGRAVRLFAPPATSRRNSLARPSSLIRSLARREPLAS
jgi:CRP-like cAMP-binding protein